MCNFKFFDSLGRSDLYSQFSFTQGKKEKETFINSFEPQALDGEKFHLKSAKTDDVRLDLGVTGI